METKKVIYGGDGCHWYKQDGEPCFEVEKKNGSGKTSTTLKHARELGLLPSVTSIFKLLDKPGLNEWKLNHVLTEVQRKQDTGQGVNLEAWKARLLEGCQGEMTENRDRGTAIHAALHAYLSSVHQRTGNMFVDLAVVKIVEAVAARVGAGVQMVFECEKSGVNTAQGYAGTIDLQCWTPDLFLLADLKCTGGKNYNGACTKKPKDEWLMQLAAYRYMIPPELIGYKTRVIASVIVNLDVPGEVFFREYSEKELEKGWQMFKSLLSYWQLSKDYDGKSTEKIEE